MSFQAKIKLGQVKAGPLTHTGFKGRVTRKGESFATTSAEEAAYYRAQPGFVVTVTKGKLALPLKPLEELDEPDESSLDDEDATDDEDTRPTEVKGVYERADLKKMSRDDLLLLIRNDDELPLKLRDVPKKAGKKEIVALILDAQKAADEDEDD